MTGVKRHVQLYVVAVNFIGGNRSTSRKTSADT